MSNLFINHADFRDSIVNLFLAPLMLHLIGVTDARVGIHDFLILCL